MIRLSNNLQPIYDYELARGNEVAQIVDNDSWPYIVWFRFPLDIEGIERELEMPTDVEQFENHDAHYPLERGYFDNENRQAVSGPISGEFHPDPEPLFPQRKIGSAHFFLADPADLEGLDEQGLQKLAEQRSAFRTKSMGPWDIAVLEAKLLKADVGKTQDAFASGMLRNFGEEGPWLYVLSAELVKALADLAPDQVESPVNRWKWQSTRTWTLSKLAGDNPSNLNRFVKEISELCGRAVSEGKQVYMFIERIALRLPAPIRQARDEAYRAMYHHPEHQLLPHYRAAIYRAIATLDEPVARFFRGRLAKLAVKRVLPVWQKELPDNHWPERLLERVEQVLQGEVPSETARREAGSEFERAAYEYETLAAQGLTVAGHCVLAAAVEAVFEASGKYRLWDEVDDKTTDVELDPEGVDTAHWAWGAWTDAFAYREPKSPPKFDREKSKEYWEWWLSEAVPGAWQFGASAKKEGTHE